MSTKTTFLGPLVSFRTSAAQSETPVHVVFPSTGSVSFGDDPAGVPIKGVIKSTVSVALGTLGHDSVTSNSFVEDAAVGDIVLHVQPASIWSGAYFDVDVTADIPSTSTVRIIARNSAVTAINTAAMNFDIYWLDLT